MQKNLLLIILCMAGLLTSMQAQTRLTLQQALSAAKSNSPFLKPVQLNTAIAQGDVVSAGLRPNPVLNNQTLQLMNEKNFVPDTKFYNPRNRQVWWQLTKQFQVSGQRKYKLDVATKNVTVTEKVYADAERNILSAAGNKWLDVWINKVNLDLIQEAKINIDSLVKIQEIRLKNQVISSSELAQIGRAHV